MGVAAVVALVGAAIAAGQQKQAGVQEKGMANYQADQLEANAQATRDQGELNASAIRRQGRRQAKAATAAMAASGVGLGSPTAININEDINAISEENALNAIITGGREANMMKAKGDALRIGGQEAMRAANIQAATTVGSSLASAYGGSSSGWAGSKKSSNSWQGDQTTIYKQSNYDR